MRNLTDQELVDAIDAAMKAISERFKAEREAEAAAEAREGKKPSPDSVRPAA